MKINKYLKYIISILLFSVIIFLTFRTIFYHNNINDILRNFSNININYILICLILVVIYFLLQGFYMKKNLNLFNVKINLLQGLFYSLVEFFFSGITPSSTGGQPVQLYYMNKDKIPKKKAFITLLINTIFFKLIIVILGILIFIFNHDMLFNLPLLFVSFYFLGIIFDILIVLGGYLLLNKPSILKKILNKIEYIIKKIFKNYEMKIDENIKMYINEVNNLKKHKLELLFEFFITFLQRMSLFSISYIIYLAFGLSEYNFFQIVIIQISVQTAIEFIPLPGGTGVSEYLFNLFFITIFGSALSSTAMLATRTFSFYIPLILSGIIILIKYLIDIRINKLEKCKNKNYSSLYGVYKKTLSKKTPEFLQKYLNVPSLVRLKNIDYFCGMQYASKNIYDFKENISRYDHSLTVALLTWKLTKDKTATLASLFHDVATPCFSHVIDYMNKDYEIQESTEEYTEEIILNDEILQKYLKEDNILSEDIIDFKKYKVVDNNRPKLCADRLDGIILTGIAWTKTIFIKDIIEIVNNLKIYINEENEKEIGFTSKEVALKVLHTSDEINKFCHTNEDNFMMELLANITKTAIDKKIIKYDDLYCIDEQTLISILKTSENKKIKDLFTKFETIELKDIPNINLKNVKNRNINPLLKNGRLSDE